MDSPTFNGQPGAMPYDPEHEPRREREPEPLVCDQCGEQATHTRITDAGRSLRHCADHERAYLQRMAAMREAS